MARYTVWHTTGKLDGDSSFDDLDAAMSEFDSQSARREVVEVELTDNADPADPKMVVRVTRTDENE